MDLQDFGNIGEFISAFFIIISVIYLAIQVRESSRATRFDSLARIRTYTSEAQKILTNPDSARIWRVGLAEPEALSEDERISFYNILTLTINNVDLRKTYELANGITNAFGADTDSVTVFCGYPGFQRWWRNARKTYGPSMIDYVEASIKEAAERGA